MEKGEAVPRLSSSTPGDPPLKEAFLKQLLIAFPLEPVPEKIVDSLGGGDEPAIVHAIFIGKKWNEVAYDSIHYSSLHGFMCKDAFVYYLPLFMSFCLNEFETAFSFAVYDSLIHHLTAPTSSSPVGQLFWDRVGTMSRLQKQAVRDFLLLEIETHKDTQDETQEAFQSYWHQFSTNKTAQE